MHIPRQLAFLAFCLAFLVATPALAHNADQLPFLAVDGQSAKVYPVGSTSLTTLALPQDLAPGTYLVHQAVSFTLLPENLPILPQFLSGTAFTWDFGDGSPPLIAQKATHAYAKMGSYVLSLHSSSQEAGQAPQLLDMVLVNVLPDASYQLPKAVVKANGKQPSNPYTDILKFNLHVPLQLDGSSSSSSTDSTTVLWDLGDQQSAGVSKVIHTYDPLLKYVLPMLRITDSNGFFSDAFLQIEDDPSQPGFTVPSTPDPTQSHARLLQGVAGLVLPAAALAWGLLRRRRIW